MRFRPPRSVELLHELLHERTTSASKLDKTRWGSVTTSVRLSCYGLLMSGRREWDVVVVGGGAAGCVVAARLAESGSRSVLLLEAGPDLRLNLPEELRNGCTIGATNLSPT